MRLSQLTMRIINFSDNTTYVSDGESYRLDGRNHNIQRIDKKWMVDCLIQYKACTLVMKPNHNCSMPLDFVQWL